MFGWVTLIVKGIGAVADLVRGVADARKADKDAALNGYAAGRAASDASKNAGHEPPRKP